MTFDLDRRTRCDDDYRNINPTEFFTQDFPHLAATHGHHVAAGINTLSAKPLSVETCGSIWTIFATGDELTVRDAVSDDSLVIKLTQSQFSDWAQNQISLGGLLVSRTLEFQGGTEGDISTWDSLWISLLEGWPVVDDQFKFVNRHGDRLDLTTSFTTDDDAEDIAHFLHETGFLHLHGWLDPADMGRISDDMDEAKPHYSEGDSKSWWASLKDGSRTCVRLQEFIEHSSTTTKILSSDTWVLLRKILAGNTKLEQKPVEGRIIEALFKPVGVVSGPSDLAFHRDCHLGRHAYECSRIIVGIALTPSNESNGMLRVIAGSHRLGMPAEMARNEPYLPIVTLATEPGDLTVHLSCTLHESTAPSIMERRVMYTELSLAPFSGTKSVETSVNAIREQVSDILRTEEKIARQN